MTRDRYTDTETEADTETKTGTRTVTRTASENPPVKLPANTPNPFPYRNLGMIYNMYAFTFESPNPFYTKSTNKLVVTVPRDWSDAQARRFCKSYVTACDIDMKDTDTLAFLGQVRMAHGATETCVVENPSITVGSGGEAEVHIVSFQAGHNQQY